MEKKCFHKQCDRRSWNVKANAYVCAFIYMCAINLNWRTHFFQRAGARAGQNVGGNVSNKTIIFLAKYDGI